MGAAIVSHMLVLLQFQQWEDNQEALGNPTYANNTIEKFLKHNED